MDQNNSQRHEEEGGGEGDLPIYLQTLQKNIEVFIYNYSLAVNRLHNHQYTTNTHNNNNNNNNNTIPAYNDHLDYANNHNHIIGHHRRPGQGYLPTSEGVEAEDEVNAVGDDSISSSILTNLTYLTFPEDGDGNFSFHGNGSGMPRYTVPRISAEIQIVLYALIFLLAFVGNLLVIVTLFQNKRMRTVTNVFLINLAVSDLLLAVFCMPFTLVPVLLRNFIFGAAMCVLIRYLQADVNGVMSEY